jgi:hypothetical protein
VNEDAVRRVTGSTGDVLGTLVSMRGADLATLLLEVARQRAEALDPAEVVRRYRSDRFVHPAQVDADSLRDAQRLLFGSLPDGFQEVTLSPLVPFGTHRIAGVAQSRVVSTVRGTEVAADPTNGLALEAARRRQELIRRHPGSTQRVNMAASQRVVRAQTFEGDASFAHFELFGLVTAGRDTGNLIFEREAIAEHVRFVTDVLHTATGWAVIVEITDLTGGGMAALMDAVREAVDGAPAVEVRDRPSREGGRDYYDRSCFKASVSVEGEAFEVADGGLVDWTQRLVASRKERLMISGVGVERLAMLMAGRAG